MQIEINSSSLGPFKLCPRRYYYEILWQWRSRVPSVHLAFGDHLHRGRQQYALRRAHGHGHDEALSEVIEWAMIETWDALHGRAIDWGHPKKTRSALVRALVWYLDQFGENDAFTTAVLADGSPAIEVHFKFPLASMPKPISLCGTLDRVAEMNGDLYVLDIKTTEHQIDSGYFQRYSPDNQFSLYALAGQVLLSRPIRGIICDAIQVGHDFVRMQRGLIPRDGALLEEWLYDAQEVIKHMGACATSQYWPQNDKACGLWGGCPFRAVCGASPSSRQTILEANFTREGT